MTPNEPNKVQAASVTPELPGTPIRPAGSFTAPGRAKAPSAVECIRPYINDQQNSRLPADVPTGPLNVRWSTPLPPEYKTTFVLASADAIATQATGRWQLFSAEGKSIAIGKTGPGDLVLDPTSALLYSIEPNGVIEAHRLGSGELAWSLGISGGEEWQRAFYARRGVEFAVVSFRRLLQPHAAVDPSGVSIDVQNLGDPVQIEQGIVVSAKQTSRLYFEAPRAAAALLGTDLVAAIRSEILITNFGRSVRTRLTGEFDAGPLSVDEGGRMYLLVNPAGARTSLWVLKPTGDRMGTFEIPEDFSLAARPPVIGYDHRVYLAARNEIMAVTLQGTLVWRTPSEEDVAGMAVTPDGHLIVAEGSTLSAFDSNGHRRVLHQFAGEMLVTPPAMAPNGDLLVASNKHLYRLTAR